jgi:hypothetical protein
MPGGLCPAAVFPAAVPPQMSRRSLEVTTNRARSSLSSSCFLASVVFESRNGLHEKRSISRPVTKESIVPAEPPRVTTLSSVGRSLSPGFIRDLPIAFS